MRIETACQSTLRELLDHGSIRSCRAARHLHSCSDCQDRLISYAHSWAALGHQEIVTDETLADRVMNRIDLRERRFRLAMQLGYIFASLVASVIVVLLAGPEIYNRALVPLGHFLTIGVTTLPSFGKTLIASLARLFSGEALLAVGAAIAVVWVGMLDKIVGLVRPLRA